MRRVDETAESGNEMRLSSDESAEVVNTDDLVAKIATVEVATIIFSFFHYSDIMRLRRVCKTWRDAAKKTIVPLSEPKFEVTSVRKYNAMRVMSTVLPNLQQLSLNDLVHLQSVVHRQKYNDGEDPDERRARHTANWATHDIKIISRFSKLRSLKIWDAPLNGRYPVLFGFPLLQRLTVLRCHNLKWDLEMLKGLPLLKELYCYDDPKLAGSLSSLIVLKDTLEKVKIMYCYRIGGNFMDLADFPHLRELDLRDTGVRGDIRDIREHHFSALESLFLPKSVHGGIGYKFQRISDVPEFMHTIRLLLQRTPTLFGESQNPRTFDWSLSRHSPDWYRGGKPLPPFYLQFIQAGSRLGWSWCTEDNDHSCEINWLDPEPSSESGDYEAYIEKLQDYQNGNGLDFYRGYYELPTEEEYHRLCEGLWGQF